MPESTQLIEPKHSLSLQSTKPQSLILRAGLPLPILMVMTFGLVLTLLLMLAMAGTPPALAAEATPQFIEAEELSRRLDDPALFIVDVRTEASWRHSPKLIPGAVRIDPRDLDNLAQQIPRGHEVILYCA